ncbi:hypothetical protein AQUCO_06600031v1 [Aquilegia coerulea]|uniref:Uncharacterized protein n=1 Tax=Aquilegia coerulea TaxID=218851 RepID=A0A2G5CC32_AQUCA|nr:hypothetical protein AQUCO_06600031v1 [Aquilegia coerulea]
MLWTGFGPKRYGLKIFSSRNTISSFYNASNLSYIRSISSNDSTITELLHSVNNIKLLSATPIHLAQSLHSSCDNHCIKHQTIRSFNMEEQNSRKVKLG